MDEQKFVETHETTTHTVTEPVLQTPAEQPAMYPEPKEKRDLVLPVSILIGAVMITGALIFTTLYKGGGAAPVVAGNTTSTSPAGNILSSASTTALLALTTRDAILGSSDAPVTLIEYGDYQCPYCAEYFQNVQPEVLKDYISTGKVKMVFRNFAFLGPESTAAAEAAECAEDQNELWPYHDALYSAKVADYAKGGKEDDGVLNRALFLHIAQQLGMNIQMFTSCIDTNKYAGVVAQEVTDAGNVGVQSTPTTFIDGVMVTDSTGANVGADTSLILQDLANATAGK